MVHGFVKIQPFHLPMLQCTAFSVTSSTFIDPFRLYSFTPANENIEEPEKENIVANHGQAEKASPKVSSIKIEDDGAASLQQQTKLLQKNPSNRKAWWWWRLGNALLKSDRTRRQAQNQLKVNIHHFLRDSGSLRATMDFLVTVGVPSLAFDNPDILPRFLQLTKDCTRVPYGNHPLQGIDVILPKTATLRGLLFFVHGGAWGSGLPWMYRLIAQPFLDMGMAVAIVGYRTFPDGTVPDQVRDLEMASKELTRRFPDICQSESDFGVCAMGHSSGAHIIMQMLVNRLQRQIGLSDNTSTTMDEYPEMRLDTFISMSAPYEIASHYEFESLRGLQDLSPMKAACGNDVKRLSNYSPVLQFTNQLNEQSLYLKSLANDLCPHMAMIHGVQDETVPFTSTRQAVKLLRNAGITKCDSMFMSETGHSDTVFELMFGGKTQSVVMDWLEHRAAARVNNLS